MADDSTKKIGVDISDFRKGMEDARRQIRLANAEFKAASSAMDDWSKSSDGIGAKLKQLNTTMNAQSTVLNGLKEQYKAVVEEQGENSKGAQELAIKIANQEAAVNKTKKSIDYYESSLAELSDENTDVNETSGKAQKGIKGIGDEATKTEKKSSALGEGLKKLVKNGILAVGAAATTAATGLAALTVQGGEYADEVLTISTNTGIATDSLQKYKYALNFIDGDLNTLTKTIEKNKIQMGAAAKGNATAISAYEKLGISIKNSDGSFRDSEEVYWEVIDALGKVTNEVERDCLATDLLGKGSKELRTVIEAGSEAFKEYGDEAERMGAVMSGDNLNALGAFDDKMQQLKAGIGGLKNAGAMIALPFLDTLANEGVTILGDFTTSIQKANGETNKIGSAIGGVLTQGLNLLVGKLPEFIGMGVSLVKSLVDGIVQNLPAIVSATLQIADVLVNGLMGLTPILWQASFDLIIQLAQGLMQGIQEQIPNVIAFLLSLISITMNNAPLLLETALNLITGLAQGILQAIPSLVEVLPTIIQSIVSFMSSSIPLIMDAGINLLMGIVEALPTIIDSLVEALPLIIQTLVDFLVNNVPLLVDASLQLLMALIYAMPLIIPPLVKAIPQIITAIVTTLIDNAPKLLEAGSKMFNSLLEALNSIDLLLMDGLSSLLDKIVSSISGIIDRLKEVGANIIAKVTDFIAKIKDTVVEKVTSLVDAIRQAGSDLVTGLWNGITDKWEWLKSKITGFGKGVIDGIKGVFKIKSPSRVMRDEIGKYLVEGIAVGINNYKSKVYQAFDDIKGHITAPIGVNIQGSSGTSGTNNNYVFNQYNNSPKALSRLEIYRQTKNQLAFAKEV